MDSNTSLRENKNTAAGKTVVIIVIIAVIAAIAGYIGTANMRAYSRAKKSYDAGECPQ